LQISAPSCAGFDLERPNTVRIIRHHESWCFTFSASVGSGDELEKFMYDSFAKAGILQPQAGEDCAEGRLLGESKATPAGFGPEHVSRAVERRRRDDTWGLDLLEEAEREKLKGEG
jgi:hypothetical protein